MSAQRSHSSLTLNTTRLRFELQAGMTAFSVLKTDFLRIPGGLLCLFPPGGRGKNGLAGRQHNRYQSKCTKTLQRCGKGLKFGLAPADKNYELSGLLLGLEEESDSNNPKGRASRATPLGIHFNSESLLWALSKVPIIQLLPIM